MTEAADQLLTGPGFAGAARRVAAEVAAMPAAEDVVGTAVRPSGYAS